MQNDKTYFGFKEIDKSEKSTLVEQVFSKVSDNYDLMNDIMSFGLHRWWKEIVCHHLDNPNASLIDVAGGTGDIANKFYKFSKTATIEVNNNANNNPLITLCDINAEMLRKARVKAINNGILDINYIQANAETMPFQNDSFDYYTICFGLRNITETKNALSEAYRILKPKGKFLCLELYKIDTPIIKDIYDFYSMNIIPLIGQLVSNDRESYEYLVESIRRFCSQSELLTLMRDVGFQDCSYTNINNGVVAIHIGYKDSSL